jgi:hypothetical protein
VNYLVWLLAKINTGGGSGEVDVPKLSMTELVANVLNIIYFGVGVTAVIMIILAGINYMTANGDPSKAQKALRTIIYCSIGLAVVIFAFVLTNFVAGRIE